MATSADRIRVEVVYALPERQRLVACELVAPATLRDAIEASGLLAEYPQIDLARARVGVFGRVQALDAPVREGDRVEIYRPLQADPKEVRRRRAAEKRGARR